MKARLVALGVAFVALGNQVQVEAADYPIRWTERVELESLDQVGKLLAEPGLDLELFRYDRVRRQKESKHVDNCQEFLSAYAEGFGRSGSDEHISTALWTNVRCTLLAKLQAAKPAARSFVANLKLDEAMPDVLPPEIELDMWWGELAGCLGIAERLNIATREGLSWSVFHRQVREEFWSTYSPSLLDDTSSEIHLHEKLTPNLAVYSFGPEDGWNASIEILAWADFNGDGLEDVFMLEGPSIFILTRYSETAVLIHTDQEPLDYLSRCG